MVEIDVLPSSSSDDDDSSSCSSSSSSDESVAPRTTSRRDETNTLPKGDPTTTVVDASGSTEMKAATPKAPPLVNPSILQQDDDDDDFDPFRFFPNGGDVVDSPMRSPPDDDKNKTQARFHEQPAECHPNSKEPVETASGSPSLAHSRRRMDPPLSDDTEGLEIPRPPTPDQANHLGTSRFFGVEQGDDDKMAPPPATSNVSPTQGNVHDNAWVSPTLDESAPNVPNAVHQEPPSFPPPDEPSQDVRPFEVDPSLLQGPLSPPKSKPMLQYLSLENRPHDMRQRTPVKNLFAPPLSHLWRRKFNLFNHLQSEVSHRIVDTHDNLVVSAPTGAGKTALFEMALARFLAADLCGGQASHTRKAIYVSPSRALCEERYHDWSKRLADMGIGIQCAMVTGDTTTEESGDAFSSIALSHVILTTPEKWDSLTRRWTEHAWLIGSVKLFLVDEVHLLGDGSRGICLESIIARMKTIDKVVRAAARTYQPHVQSSYAGTSVEALSSFLRIVAVSATLPNVADIASFIDANEALVFDASYRPVPLSIHVVGCGAVGKNPFMFGKGLEKFVPGLVSQFSQGKPSIIFCHTKKDAENLADQLSARAGRDIPGNVPIAGQSRLKALQRCLLRGVAYHHAGLDASDRKLVEKAFGDGRISCLCATSTLACGVNLPAHLVIIKGTVAWRGSHQEIDRATLLQMLGRAGRPGFDTSGTAVIMTDDASKSKYENQILGMEVVESHLPSRLVQVLNSEISQRVVTTLDDAVNWIKTTFFFSRVQDNPHHYGLPKIMSESQLDDYLRDICTTSIEQLCDDQIVDFDRATGSVYAMAASHIMCQRMVEFDAMRQIIGLPFDITQGQLVSAISEFEGLHKPVRRAEKKFLKEAHKEELKYKLDGPPSKVLIQTPSQKAFVLLQCAIGQYGFDDFTLTQEMSSMVDYATRMLSAIEEFSIEGSMHGQVAVQSFRLKRSLDTSLWGATDGVLNQLPGVTQKSAKKLKFNNIISFQDVLAASSEDLELAAGRTQPFGTELQVAVRKILRNSLHLSASIGYDANNVPEEIICIISAEDISSLSNGYDDKETAGIVKYTLAAYTDKPGGGLLYQSHIVTPGEYRFSCPKLFGKVFVHLLASLVGLDEKQCLEGNIEVHKSSFTASPAKAGTQKRKSSSKSAGAKRVKRSVPETSGTGTSRVRADRQTKITEVISEKPEARHRFIAPVETSRVAHPTGNSNAITPSPRVPPSDALFSDKASGPRRTVHAEQGRRMLPKSTEDRGSVRLRGVQNSAWKQDKRAQKSFQKSAFRHEKENPFSVYNYDPNDIESNLEAVSTQSAMQQNHHNDTSNSVIPPHARSNMSTTRGPRQGIFGGRRASGAARRGNDSGRKRRNVSSMHVPEPELLRMKAEEQQAYSDRAMSQHMHPSHEPLQEATNVSPFYDRDGSTFFSDRSVQPAYSHQEQYEPERSAFSYGQCMQGTQPVFSGNYVAPPSHGYEVQHPSYPGPGETTAPSRQWNQYNNGFSQHFRDSQVGDYSQQMPPWAAPEHLHQTQGYPTFSQDTFPQQTQGHMGFSERAVLEQNGHYNVDNAGPRSLFLPTQQMPVQQRNAPEARDPHNISDTLEGKLLDDAFF